MKYIYTIGNCSGVSHAEAKKWRDSVQEYFDTWAEDYVKVINITDYYSYETKFHETDKEIANFCERSIKKADAVIINNHFLSTSRGSGSEIGLSRAYQVPMFIFDEYENPKFYPWDEYWCERLFTGEYALSECCDHVLKYIINA